MESIVAEVARVFLEDKSVNLIDKLLLLFLLPYTGVVVSRIYKFVAKLPGYHEEKKVKLKKNFPNNVLRNKLLQSALEKMVYDGGADRAYIIQFHNGGENIKGMPFIKFSVTNEWCPISVPKEMDRYKEVPIGIYSGLIYLVLHSKNLYLDDIEDLRTLDSSAYAIFKSKNVKSVYISGIFDLQDSIIGLVVMEHFDSSTQTKDDLFIFEKTVGVISGLVMCVDGADPNVCCNPTLLEEKNA